MAYKTSANLTHEDAADIYTKLTAIVEDRSQRQSLMIKLRKAFLTQRSNSQQRDLGWEFDFKEWLNFWIDSGHVLQRGVRKGEYVMSRFNDIGSYSKTNCEIILSTDNHQQPQSLAKRAATINLRPDNWTRSDDHAHLKDRSNHPKGRKVVCPDGVVYPSAAVAAEAHNRTRQSIAQRCRTGWGGWHYADDERELLNA
jgi:hypothetical protein